MAGPGPAAQTQHQLLQARRCSFMTPLPSMNLRLFPPQVSARPPLTPCQAETRPSDFLPGSFIPDSDHSSPHVLKLA